MERIRKEVAAYAKVPGVARGPHETRWKIQREWFFGTTLLDLLWVFGYAVLIIGIVEDFVFFAIIV